MLKFEKKKKQPLNKGNTPTEDCIECTKTLNLTV